jgi:4-hydroxy-3-polyprenylbenzoate decarboxylase
VSRYFVGLTGASGHVYAAELVRALVHLGHSVDLSITDAGAKVLRHELGIEAGPRGEQLHSALPGWFGAEAAARLRAFPSEAVEAPPSSGTSKTAAYILCPCSMGTLARVAAGFSSNLVERAADVAMKEGRPLVLVPREAPYSAIHLTNMLELARLGAIILPASPGFYHRPTSIADLVRHVVGKILDRLRVEHEVSAPWQGFSEERGTEGGGRAPRKAPRRRKGRA